MGYRMEIGEVEAALQGLQGLQEECVLFDSNKDLLWCFFTGDADEKEIRAGLKEKLARYMIPDRFVKLEEMPHTSSMKTDRMALKSLMNEE
jgi:acyl-coenzyme A synthetase/AMP-(fatty) acid ligase